MKRFSPRWAVLLLLLIALFPVSRALGGDDLLKQLEHALKSGLQKNLFEQFIRFDKRKNMVSFSPTLMKMAADKAGKSFGHNLQSFDLKPEGNALNFSLGLKSGTSIAASIEPEALEVNAEEMAIVGRLPQGLKIEGVDLQKTVSGFFDNLFGASPSPLSSSASSSISTTPSQRPRSFSVTDVLKSFSVEGNTFRLKRPLKSSALGRSLASSMATTSAEKTASASLRLPMKMENGWLN
ncbi:MAG TPA: hypothetical protein PKM25_10310, partial [Candidatus Ozemobacteraceae bacterium]|nr:hypothetical protein [Candidatus Ozemobacteraceae bacterium]